MDNIHFAPVGRYCINRYLIVGRFHPVGRCFYESLFNTVDGRNPAPPKKPWNDDSPVNTNNQWFPMVAKWSRISSTHSSGSFIPLPCSEICPCVLLCRENLKQRLPGLAGAIHPKPGPQIAMPGDLPEPGAVLWRVTKVNEVLPLILCCELHSRVQRILGVVVIGFVCPLRFGCSTVAFGGANPRYVDLPRSHAH